jgi:hypothetical protein
MADVAGIARNLSGRRQGDNWRCPCPLGCGYVLSLREGEDGKLLAYCFGGCEFPDIIASLVEYGLLDDGGDVVLPCGGEHASTARSVERDAHRIGEARRIYTEAGPGSLVATYLYEARGISLLPPVILKEHLHCPHRLGLRLRAMVAPVVDLRGEQTGVHMTYLRPDGSGKADLGHPGLQRECRGVIRGGTIRLAAHDPDRPLLIGEGLESTLSAMEIFGLPGWAAVSAGGLKTLELPLSVRNVVIAADNDHSGAGQRNALAAYDRWTGEGRSVCIRCPSTAGHDYNDMLNGRARR